MSIHILHVVDSLGKGGLETGLTNLINHLQPSRFQHTILAVRQLGPSADRLPQGRVRIECLEKKDTDPRFQVPILVRRIRQIGPDIVHSRNWGTIEAVIAARFLRIRSIHSEHGIDSATLEVEPTRRVWVRRLAFRLTQQVLTVSEQLRDFHAERTGLEPSRIAVIHNGVDIGQFRPDPNARACVRQEFGLSENEFCIGCVGNLFPIKDHLTLLEALTLYSEHCRDWRLLLVGDGPERTHLQEFVRTNSNLANRVVFLGSSARVKEILNAFDVYVLPSISEGISNSLLEAMATGLAPVLTLTGGNPEVVRDQESGLLFPVRDRQRLSELLLSLHERPTWRLQLGEQARRRVSEQFSIYSMVQKYERLYCGIPAEMRTPAPAMSRA